MRDVGVCEAKVVGTNAGGAAFLSAAMDGAVFAECIAVSHDERGGFTRIFEVLRFDANGGEGEKFILLADFTVTVNDDM